MKINFIKSYLLCVIVALLSCCKIGAYQDVSYTTDKTVTPGKWNSNFTTTLAYAEEHHIPVIQYYGVYGCTYAENGVKVLNQKKIVDWFAKKRIAMIYKRSTTGKAAEVAWAKTPQESPDPDQWRADRWAIVDNVTAYPIMRFYWKRENGETASVTFTMRNKQMPVKEPAGTSIERLTEQMYASLEQFFRDYTPEPEPTPEEETYNTKLTPSSSVDEFMGKINSSKTTINLVEWSSNGSLCLSRAKETGYPMLWVLANKNSLSDLPNGAVSKLVRNSFCKQSFCDLINNYGYIILCYEFIDSDDVRNRYNSVHGYGNPSEILNEETGEYETNHRGYPILGPDGKYTVFCPSVTLLKIDSSINILFHVCGDYGVTNLTYETSLSPYSQKYPVNGVNLSDENTDWFSKWLENYLNMFRVKDQVSAYETSGFSVPTVNHITSNITVAVTETIHPTAHQIALHRDNILFRTVTVLQDIAIKRRIGESYDPFDEHIRVKGIDGKMILNHDDTVSVLMTTMDSDTRFDIIPYSDCIIKLRQRSGNGFSIVGYDVDIEEVVSSEQYMSELGTTASRTVTNVVTSISKSSFYNRDVGRGESFEHELTTGKLYRVSSSGNSVFDVFCTKDIER